MVARSLGLCRPRLCTIRFLYLLGFFWSAYLGWFAATQRLSPAKVSTAMLLVPLVGVISAAPILGERLGAREGFALALTLGGVALAVRKPLNAN